MTPQAFSYGTIGNNDMIYVPPYGLFDNINYMLKINPVTFEIKKIEVTSNDFTERWTYGVPYQNKIFFLPYNEKDILIVDTIDDSFKTVTISWPDSTEKINGKYVSFHLHGAKIIALPYGENNIFDLVMIFDVIDYSVEFVKLQIPINDQKKWHTTQIVDGIIYGVPRGERWEGDYFPYRIEFDCDRLKYNLVDMRSIWNKFDQEENTNKKYTTLAKFGKKLYAPPYSENPNFDILLKMSNQKWSHEHIKSNKTSRKYFTHITASNGKIFFPPAGHDENWSEMLVVDTVTEKWYNIDLGIKKESKKYFAGCENSNGKIYFIPRGGCVCEPEESWKSQGDLAEVLVVDIKDDIFYTVDISEHFRDNTTIEKYNCCLIYKDKIFAFPYGESKGFHTMLVFDTLLEKVIHTVNLDEV